MVRYTVPLTDFFLRAARGKLKDRDGNVVVPVNKFGKNADLDLAAEEDIISIGGTLDLTQLDGAVTTVTITSAHANDVLGGAGAEKVRLYGLDANYELQDAEFSLNAVPVVTTGYNWRFIYRAKVTQSNNGANDAVNVGLITFSKSAGNNIMQIDVGTNQTLHCAYMIPANHVGYLYNFYFNYENAPATDNGTVKIWVKEFGFPYNLKEEHIILDGTDLQRPYKLPSQLPAKSIIKLSASVGQNNTVWTAGFDILVMPDSYDHG